MLVHAFLLPLLDFDHRISLVFLQDPLLPGYCLANDCTAGGFGRVKKRPFSMADPQLLVVSSMHGNKANSRQDCQE
jgi:hypothetical protein